jgi:hypothetical protein
MVGCWSLGNAETIEGAASMTIDGGPGSAPIGARSFVTDARIAGASFQKLAKGRNPEKSNFVSNSTAKPLDRAVHGRPFCFYSNIANSKIPPKPRFCLLWLFF